MTKLTRYSSLFLLSVITFFLCASKPSFARDDWQYWHSYQLNMKASEAFKVRINGQHRLRNDFHDSFFGRIETAALWKPTSFFEIGPAIKYQRSKNNAGKHTNEMRYYLEGALKTKWKSFTLTNRHRIAYRDKNTKDAWLYRTQFKLAYTLPIKKLKMTPYVANEIFYDTRLDYLNQNRVTLGYKIDFTKLVGLNVFYMIKSDRARESSWQETSVLGTGVNLTV